MATKVLKNGHLVELLTLSPYDKVDKLPTKRLKTGSLLITNNFCV